MSEQWAAGELRVSSTLVSPVDYRRFRLRLGGVSFDLLLHNDEVKALLIALIGDKSDAFSVLATTQQRVPLDQMVRDGAIEISMETLGMKVVAETKDGQILATGF